MIIKNIFRGLLNYIYRSDMILWGIVAVISAYSLVLLGSVSEATESSDDRRQMTAILLGVLGAIIISLIDYESLTHFWHVIAIFSVFIMIYTMLTAEAVVGVGGVDARAWIKIGGLSFQPSELVKIGFIVTYSKHLDTLTRKNLIDEPLHLILLCFHAIVPFLLCHSQGDDGTGLVFLVMFIAMSFSAGVKARYFLILFVLFIIMIPILWNFVLGDYQKSRFSALFALDDAAVRSNEGYQQYQGRISIASGQFSGVGLGKSERIPRKVVSYQESDFIFSVAGEELGFLGCMGIILLLLLLLVKLIHVAATARDNLGKYICFGYFAMIAFQSITNIGMCLNLFPVMGVTLPFFSAGGSSAMCLYFGIGLVQSVFMRRKETDGMRLNRNDPIRFHYKQMKRL